MQDIVPLARGPRPYRALLAALAVLVVVAAGIVIGFRNTAALGTVQSVARSYGYDVNARTFDVGPDRLRASDLRVRNRAGEPVLDARSVDVAYSLRDLLPGGKRLFGLRSVTIVAPHVTVIHHADGTYNITVPQAAPNRSTSAGPPLDVRLNVADGSVDLIDRFVVPQHERHERLTHVHADGMLSPASGSYYHAGAQLEAGSGRYPIVGNARFEDPRGYEVQHWTADRIPIAGLANFALSSHAIQVQGGEIRRLDARVGALPTASGALAQHLGLTGQLVGVRLAATALTKPIRDGRGTFVVDDDSVTLRSFDAAINGIAVHLRGALYDFASPQVAVAVTARGDLAEARALSADSAKLPIGGTVAIQGLAEGPASNPLIFATVSAPRVVYGTYRLDGSRGLAALSGNELDVVSAAARYGGIGVAGRGQLSLARHTRTSAYALIAVPADGIPVVANLVPGMPLAGTAVVRGRDGRLAARGYVGGAHGGDRIDVPFALAADGSGTIGPVALERHDGASVYARAALDPGAKRTVAIVDVRRLSLLPAPAVQLPGLAVPALPASLDAKLDATLTGSAAGNTLTSATGSLHAYGSWGDVRADAAGAAGGFAARGRLASSFERLAALTGKLDARGPIDVPFAVTNSGRSTILQIAGARFPGATIHGISLQSASATVGLALPAIDVYAADLRVADRDITATGRFGNGGRLHITAGDLDLRAARAAGLPLAGGRATVIADVGGTYAKPTADILAALAGARYAGTDVGGDVGLAYDGTAMHIDRATVTYGGAYANATGAVDGLTLGRLAPRYDIRASLEDGDIAGLARTVKNPLRYPEGTLDADVRVGGAGATPSVRGDVRIPEGSLNGLNFRDGRIAFAGTPSALTARNGELRVGTTTLDFSAAASRTQQSVRLAAPHIDLADFNDYFDEADVLAGTGNVAVALDASPRALHTSAKIALRATRYRRFDFGNVSATVGNAGNAIRLQAALDGPNGRVHAGGSVAIAGTDPLRDIVRRSLLDLDVRIDGINLASVLPAAGLSVPVLGFVDGSAVVRGRYPALALSLHAALSRGAVGRVPIERLTIAATAANGRGTLTDATLVAPGLTANISGAFGLRPADVFDLQAQALSPDINTLIATTTGKNLNVRGALATRAHLTGTLARPQLSGSFDATNVAYSGVTIPSVHADLRGTRQAVAVNNGNITLPRGGTIAFDAMAPLGDGARTPIALDFAPHRVDVNPYSPLLPDGSVVNGLFDGNVGVRGTLAAPRLSGELTLTGGAFRSNTLRSGLTGIALDLRFAGTRVQLAKLHARAVRGTIDGSGMFAVRDVRDPIRGLTADANVKLAGVLLEAPKYYTGYIDGTVRATKQIGAPALIGGNLTFANARIPYTALLPSGGTAAGPAPALPAVGFDVGVTVGRDVRVQSGPVDIGTTGTARLGGTLAAPTLDGQFTATDGTVALYRTFTVQNGSTVTFTAADGITPSVDATAVTNVPDPPTDVLLHVTGPSTHLNLAFSSQPAYTQQQILGLLVNAQALGAVSGVAQSGGSTDGTPSISGIGEGVLNTQLTQKFLQPFTNKLGGALGLSDLNVNYSVNGTVSAVARRTIGKNISFTYGEQIGGPSPRTSVGINIGSAIAGAQLTFFQAAGSEQPFGGQALTPFAQSGFLSNASPNYTLQAIEPPSGSGFVFSYQRHFW